MKRGRTDTFWSKAGYAHAEHLETSTTAPHLQVEMWEMAPVVSFVSGALATKGSVVVVCQVTCIVQHIEGRCPCAL